MSLTALTSRDFLGILKLLKTRRKLIAQVKQIEAILAARSGDKVTAVVATKIRTKGKRSSTKDGVLRILRAAGTKGLTVQEIAKALGRPYGSVSVWFYTAAKKVKGIKRVAPGRFAYKA